MTLPEEWFTPQVSYNVDQQVTWVSVMDSREPDPRWKFTDAAGHEHAYDEEGKTPTLELTVTSEWWCSDCNDEHEDTELQCRQCDEPVMPGTRAGPDRIGVPGVRSVYLENVPLTAGEKAELSGAGWLAKYDRDLVVVNGQPQWDRVYLTKEESSEFLAECQRRGNFPSVFTRSG